MIGETMPAWRNPDGSLAASSNDDDVPPGVELITADEFQREVQDRARAVSRPA